MEHAKRLLRETDEPIQDIAMQVGYLHSISFGRTFKKVVGVTPGDFRKYGTQ
jgi:AraC-like DNA-binding protein